MHIEPKHNNLLVEPFQLGEVSKGGLLIPQIAKASTPYRYGKVIAVGPGRYATTGQLIPVNQAVGDIIAYAKNQGVPMPLDDDDGNEREVLILNEQYVVGTIRDLPEQSRITGLDGRLLTMNPGSRAPSDIAVEQRDRIERARHEGIIDSAGGTLDRMQMLDVADMEAE